MPVNNFVFFYFTFLFMGGMALAVMRLLPVISFLCLGFAVVKQKHVQSSSFPTFLVGDERDG